MVSRLMVVLSRRCEVVVGVAVGVGVERRGGRRRRPCTVKGK